MRNSGQGRSAQKQVPDYIAGYEVRTEESVKRQAEDQINPVIQKNLAEIPAQKSALQFLHSVQISGHEEKNLYACIEPPGKNIVIELHKMAQND